jgi:hypothetical protein
MIYALDSNIVSYLLKGDVNVIPKYHQFIEAMPMYQPLHRAVGEASTWGLGSNEGWTRMRGRPE